MDGIEWIGGPSDSMLGRRGVGVVVVEGIGHDV
jgi:hypothetical protein